jgi:hypothetical protein
MPGIAMRPLLAILLAAVAAAPALAADLVPHRAAYVLRLDGPATGGVSEARGAMVVEYTLACDGWAAEQRIVLELVNAEGQVLTTDTGFTSWESKDGLRYRFNLRTVRNGELAEEYRGDARLSGAGKTGEARYSTPQGRTVKLPAGTMFPMTHTVGLLKAAAAGQGRYAGVVFDGATKEGMSTINAVFGKIVVASADDKKNPLSSVRSWNFRMAFFDVGAQMPEPMYELGMRMFENGVGGEQVMDYGEFRVRATLDRLEPLRRPKC